jgi:hypothetical protein
MVAQRLSTNRSPDRLHALLFIQHPAEAYEPEHEHNLMMASIELLYNVKLVSIPSPAEAYEPEYEHNLMYVAEYRPSDLLEADSGNVLRQARGRLEAFWTATCAAEGSFAWQAAQSFAVALMKTMQVGREAGGPLLFADCSGLTGR